MNIEYDDDRRRTTEWTHSFILIAYGIWIKIVALKWKRKHFVVKIPFAETLFDQKIICLRLRFTMMMMMSSARLHMLDSMWLNTHIWQYDSCDCDAFPFSMLWVGVQKKKQKKQIWNFNCNTIWKMCVYLDEGLYKKGSSADFIRQIVYLY